MPGILPDTSPPGSAIEQSTQGLDLLMQQLLRGGMPNSKLAQLLPILSGLSGQSLDAQRTTHNAQRSLSPYMRNALGARR